ncbi:methionine-R-sulfoxide reductase B1-like isoform X3 [Phymastichus coffea]|uniref:methionine-R-sulfoxide reductase B1-like isoform X3 n=1 Tax=Phymastichus coffea TaxID=108790 RepID=UPI00273CAD84|nr:methionine-R-sulfoxide reductase B1-like isoform X3 [Phymastichus coffea]
MEVKICKNDLKIRLTPIQWFVTQEKGTERPFSGCYNKFNGKGIYVCIVCGQELFSSKNKFDSGCGWPAFNEVLDQGRIVLKKDTSLAW